MSEFISPDDFVSAMQELFISHQSLTFVPSGHSMLPMLNGKTDKVTFHPKPPRLKRYDVAFYRRKDSGQLVLHRVVGFDKNGNYIFSGDNQYFYEYGVGDSDVLALMTSFTHNGKQHKTTDFSYRVYIHLMMLKKRVRIFGGRAYHRLRSLFSKT